MPTPLSEAFVFCLKSEATAALAALTVFAGSHRGLLDWFSRTVCGDVVVDVEARSRRVRKTNGGAANGSVCKPFAKEGYLDRRREARESRLPGASRGPSLQS
jgi:hypothetical protein